MNLEDVEAYSDSSVERVEISGASHAMHEENAPGVNEAIVGFLERHRAG